MHVCMHGCVCVQQHLRVCVCLRSDKRLLAATKHRGGCEARAAVPALKEVIRIAVQQHYEAIGLTVTPHSDFKAIVVCSMLLVWFRLMIAAAERLTSLCICIMRPLHTRSAPAAVL